MKYLKAIQKAIKKLYGCGSKHLESVPITEKTGDIVVWSGIVEVFELKNHPKAQICYGWGHHTDTKNIKSRYVTVLGIPPIDSPITAVRASIISDSKNTL